MARENRNSKNTSGGVRWRLWFGLIALGAIIASTAMAAAKVRSHLLSDPAYRLSRDRSDALTIQGLVYASRSKVQRVFAADFDRSIFSVPLDERRRRLMALDWIEDASVARIWPGRLVVRVRERKPVAFVFFPSGILLIDRQGALLDPPAQAQFTFPVLSGVREDETREQRAEHVRAMLRVQEDLGYLAKDASEINTADTDNIRMVVKMEGHAVELMLGDTNFGRRYQNFLNHYPEIAKRSPDVKTFDLRLDDRITAKE
jgi:cell division protein FtsQ